jgi:tRNA threonylcarbamoyladenosine biosynthesis protein TsaB
MILLATDTSGKNGSLALARVPGNPAQASAQSVEILEVVPLEGGTFSAQLVPQISALLARHNLTKTDIGALAVASGPGSFTGLRVGLSAIKALAEVLQKPIVEVSLLEALVRASSATGLVAGALDAGRGEVYVGVYDIADRRAILRSERLLPREEFLRAHARFVTSDQAIADIARGAGLQVELVPYPGSAAIARIGWEKLQAGHTVTPEALEANYIRRSDAEIFSSPK